MAVPFKTRLTDTVGGQQKSIAVYYDGQNAQGTPDHYISKEEASLLKAKGQARAIHRGKAILLRGPRKLHDSRRDSTSYGWKVLGQTKKGGPPGRPHWGVVHG